MCSGAQNSPISHRTKWHNSIPVTRVTRKWALGRNYNNVLVTCVNLQLKTPSIVTLSSLETCWSGEKERPFISLRLQLIESYRTNCDFLCDALYLKDKLIKWRCYVCCFTPTWRRSSVVRFVILNTILLVDLLVNSRDMLHFAKLLLTSLSGVDSEIEHVWFLQTPSCNEGSILWWT